ncbi:hypothetical protein JRO89_XS07G0014400 [Xanthoceras sorbifolium]|uniref:LYR motif-containing protein 2 n=1 Tax=Xanthoceras sorbifolium TaxID=99658 RepID=A0ABQ8HRY0_9ROSI|nr:hypothetical protein JRO89_XS07G0014400 [Xanthoceras sorbifolium]
MVLSFDLQDFILRARVLKLYRQALRTARRAPLQASGESELRQTIRQEMEKNRDCKDKQKIRFLISEGLQRIKGLDEMLDMQGRGTRHDLNCMLMRVVVKLITDTCSVMIEAVLPKQVAKKNQRKKKANRNGQDNQTCNSGVANLHVEGHLNHMIFMQTRTLPADSQCHILPQMQHLVSKVCQSFQVQIEITIVIFMLTRFTDDDS